MNVIERRRYEMLVRVRDFGKNYGDLFPGSSGAENVAAVAAAIKEARRAGPQAHGGVRVRAASRKPVRAKRSWPGFRRSARPRVCWPRSASDLVRAIPGADSAHGPEAAEHRTQVRAGRRTARPASSSRTACR